MKYSKKTILGVLFCSLLAATAVAQSRHVTKPSQASRDQDLANLLGWVPTKGPCSAATCGGYFIEPRIILDNPYPLPYTELATHITAKGPTIFSVSGQSILQKDVRVTQPGRLTTADKAYIYRDKRTGKITRIDLIGNVHMREPGKLIVSDKATLNLKKGTAEIDEAAYRIYQEKPRFGKYNGWGTAKQTEHLPSGIIKLRNATYSTCAPLSPAWQLSASRMTIDKKKKRMKAKNAVIRVHHIPILYSPYLSTSMDNQRKSGFLAPAPALSTINGFTWAQSYYFNLAPNNDLTLDAVYMAKRGVQFNSLFRYLGETSSGNLYLSFLPDDHGFRKFKKDTFAEFPSPAKEEFLPYLSQLRKTNNNRGYVAYNNTMTMSEEWTSDIVVNYVTDPYYLRDFGATINEISANQLLNQADIKYTGMRWNFSGLVQGYQTLHLIDQSTNPTVNQYSRLPQLDISGEYPNFFAGTNFAVNAEAVNFNYHSIFPPITEIQPEGLRLHILPSVSRPFNWASAYLTPTLSVDSTSYDVVRPQPGQAKTSSRNIPVVDLDSGLYFDRIFHWGSKNYVQTFEPRLFYLYVPYVNQDKFPNYDTQILPFSYDQLFATNRFTGFDRFQNASRVSLGLTSQVLDADNTYRRLKADLGMSYYLVSPKVCLKPGCRKDPRKFSPLVVKLTYNPARHWATSAGLAWDTKFRQTNNAQFDINYKRNGKNIIGGGYTFVHAQPGSPHYSALGFSNDASLYNVHVAWPITENWSTVGYVYYNISQKRAENFFAGLQYDTCCWSFRFIVNKAFIGTLPINGGNQVINKYNTNYIFQIQLKGIGSAGNSNPNALLSNSIPGYFDPFKY